MGITGYLGSEYGHLALVQGCTIDNSSISEILTSIMTTVRNYQENIRHAKNNMLNSKINLSFEQEAKEHNIIPRPLCSCKNLEISMENSDIKMLEKLQDED